MSLTRRSEGCRRIDVGAAGDVLLEHVVLDRAGQARRVDALLLGDQLVEQQQHRGRGVDGHRGRHLAQRDAAEQHPHVVDRVDRDPDLADLAGGQRRRRSPCPSGSAGRRRPTAPPCRGRSAPGSGRWTPPRCRTRRTGASSRAGRCTSRDRRPGCRGTPPVRPGRWPGRSRPARPARRPTRRATRLGLSAHPRCSHSPTRATGSHSPAAASSRAGSGAGRALAEPRCGRAARPC